MKRSLQIFFSSLCITSAMIFLIFAFFVVQSGSNKYGFEEQQSLFLSNKTSPTQIDLTVMGEKFQFSLQPLNTLAGYRKQLFTLIPAPVRLSSQLMQLSKETYSSWQQEQRQTDFEDACAP